MSKDMLPTNEAVWSVDGWLQSLSLHLIVGAALQPDGGGSVDFVRGLSRDHIVTRLRADDIEGQLAAAIDAGVKALRQQEVVTAAELNSKFASEAGFEMSFGQIALFFDGLEGLIGPPLLVEGSLHKSMEREHTACDDADTCFTSSNGMTTSSRVEWEVVVSPVEGRTYPERAGLSPPMHRSVRPLQELLPNCRTWRSATGGCWQRSTAQCARRSCLAVVSTRALCTRSTTSCCARGAVWQH
jgi:hypothetical protein